MKRHLLSILTIGFLVGLLSACASFGETPGERFRKAIKEIEAACAKRKLDPGEVCGGVAKLKPADPLSTEEGRFAHSIKIPNPVPENSGYKPGMTPGQYFEHLCKTEAGEFIFKTVENVEGLYMMRPRSEAKDNELQHLFALEDPYGYITEGSAESARNLLVRRGSYAFIEQPSSSAIGTPSYRRYIASYVGNKKTLLEEFSATTKSRFGYIWRGIRRPLDRELGIAGGELIILDAHSSEVLAVRRGFVRTGDIRNNLTGIWWLGGQACPIGKKGRTDLYTYDLLQKVVRPVSDSVDGEGNTNGSR